MASAPAPLDFLWFLPSGGDSRRFASPATDRAPDPAYLREVAVAADRLGYHGVLLPTGPMCADALVTAASVAPVTEHLRLLVALRPGLTAPAEAARQAAALDRLSGGRALLNVVTGGNPAALAADGIFLDHDARYRQTAEFLDIWRALGRGETVTRTGEFLSIHQGRLLFPFVQTPHASIWFGGSSGAARDIAACHADTYLMWGEPADQLEDVIADVRARAAALGRTLRFGVRLHFIVRETEEAAWAAAHDLIREVTDEQISQFQTYLARESDSVGQRRMQGLHRGSREALEIRPNLWAGIGLVRTGAGTALVGDPATVAARLADYAAAGVDTIIGSGYPHLEEAYGVAELHFPHLNLPARRIRQLPPLRPLFDPAADGSATAIRAT